MRHAAITGWGMSVPDRVLTNAELERMVDTTDEWIVRMTGIRERRVAGPDDSTTSLAVAAAREALAVAGLQPDDIDLIVVATCTPDQFVVSQACLVQAELGGRAAAFDIGAACSGFVYALSTASLFIQSGMHRRALVIGVDTFSRYLDFTDRSTCILFGDGAGAVILEASTEPRGLLATSLGADGSGAPLLYAPGFGPSPVAGEASYPDVEPFVKMNGREVFRFAVQIMGDAAMEAISRAGLSMDEISLFIPHQANIRIIDAAARRLNLPLDKVLIDVDRYGNTSAASVPIALVDAQKSGRLHEGDNIVLVAFGAGLTWASGVVRWGVAGVERMLVGAGAVNIAAIEQPVLAGNGAHV